MRSNMRFLLPEIRFQHGTRPFRSWNAIRVRDGLAIVLRSSGQVDGPDSLDSEAASSAGTTAPLLP